MHRYPMKPDKRTIVIYAQIVGGIIILLAGVLALAGGRIGQLAGYFLYTLAACSFLPLPTTPYVIGMGKVFHPGVVALVGAFGNCVAAIPFEPFRLAAILIHYPLDKYLLSVLLGRIPRYYLIALIGSMYQIPTRYLIAMVAALMLVPLISYGIRFMRRCRPPLWK